MKLIKKHWLLFLILLLAGILRFYKLGSNPPALSWDEAAWGYNAYSLGLTGKDEFGRFLPLNYFESFGDFKPPVYAYLTVLPVKIFGLTEFATRFPSALFGVLTVLLTYFLVKEIFGIKKKVQLPLVAAFLLSISPWHIMLSRAAFEANVASFLIVAGVTLFLAGIRRKNRFLILSAVCFALSLQTFNTARIFVPILIIVLAIVFRKQLWQQRKMSLIALAAGFLIILPAIPFLFSPQAKLRFKEVNIFSGSDVVIVANQEVVNDGNVGWSKLIHNRRWGYARKYLRHFFDHFNPAFLFFKGDGNPKFSIQDVGQLYLWELPFLILGVLLLFKQKRGYWWLIILWLFLGIVPAATARETPHALRIETSLPTWQILTALGVVAGLDWLKKLNLKRNFKFLILVFSFSLLILNVVYFQHNYWRHYPIKFSGEWEYGYKPALEFIKETEGDYEEIWFADVLGRPYIYFLFYQQIDPKEFWQEAVVTRDSFGFVNVESFGKYHFFRDEIDVQGKALVFDESSRVPVGVNVVKTIYLLNGQETLKAYEI